MPRVPAPPLTATSMVTYTKFFPEDARSAPMSPPSYGVRNTFQTSSFRLLARCLSFFHAGVGQPTSDAVYQVIRLAAPDVFPFLLCEQTLGFGSRGSVVIPIKRARPPGPGPVGLTPTGPDV